MGGGVGNGGEPEQPERLNDMALHRIKMDEDFASLRLKISTRENALMNDISDLRKSVAYMMRKAYLVSLAYLLIIVAGVSAGVSNSSFKSQIRL
jgi:hypothetical protein